MKIFGQRKRQFVKSIVWIVLPLILLMGFIYPLLGLLVLFCMLSGILIAIFGGRFWCGWLCPRGSILEKISDKFSLEPNKKNQKTYSFLSSRFFRYFFLIFMMSLMFIQVYIVWPDPEKIGLVFVRMLALTTLLAIVLALVLKPRTWCSFCPIGTISGLVASKNYLLTIEKHLCTDCKLCHNTCPISINPSSYKDEGKITNRDCFKCEACLDVCPTGAIKTTSHQ